MNENISKILSHGSTSCANFCQSQALSCVCVSVVKKYSKNRQKPTSKVHGRDIFVYYTLPFRSLCIYTCPCCEYKCLFLCMYVCVCLSHKSTINIKYIRKNIKIFNSNYTITNIARSRALLIVCSCLNHSGCKHEAQESERWSPRRRVRRRAGVRGGTQKRKKDPTVPTFETVL